MVRDQLAALAQLDPRRDRRGRRPRVVGRAPAREPRRVLRAPRNRRRWDGLLRRRREPDDALPRARVVLALPLHPRRASTPSGRRRSRRGSSTSIVGGFGSAVLLFGSALVYGATWELSFPAIAAADAVERRLPLRRARDDSRRARVQGLRRTVPHVDARRVPGRSDLGHGVHVRRDEDRRARRAPCASSSRRSRSRSDVWTIAVAVLAAISLAWGNLGALAQRDLKRILAYSSISHAGFMLMAIAAYSERGGRGAPLLPRPVFGDVRRALSRWSPPASASSAHP